MIVLQHKNIVDEELLAHDFKKNIKSGKYVEDAKEFGNKFLDTITGIWKGGKNTNQSLTDKVIPTKYRKGKEHYNDGGQITPVKGIGRWGGKDVPGMFKGGTK